MDGLSFSNDIQILIILFSLQGRRRLNFFSIDQANERGEFS
jgi:hypothetical protein